ncbi:MAG TPA: hypothetical protein VLB80_00890 [Candidatus Babeliales bacterium]|nr:hypothetical protein [Candidatus Babeliales bacterium]
MVGNEINNNYLCCFCNTLIIPSHGNPMEIDILINFDKPKSKQDNQTFYCHMECFKEQLDPKLKIHFHLDSFIKED